MLLPLLYSIMRKCRSPSSCIGMSAHVFALTSVRFLPQKLQHCALFVFWISQRSVDVAHSYSCSLIHVNPLLLTLLLTYLQICAHSCLTSAPPPPLSILSLADSVIHNWYIGGYSLSMPDARRLFSDLSLP